MTHDSANVFDFTVTQTSGDQYIKWYFPKVILTLPKEETMTIDLTDIRYTDEWSGRSSAVDEALYDADTKNFYITLDGGSTYAYENVDGATWRAFKTAFSKGRFYAKSIKTQFGPGTYLGYEALEDAEKRGYEAPAMDAVVAGTGIGAPKHLSYAVDAVVDGKPVTPKTEATATTYNLSTVTNIQPALLEDRLEHTVRFRVGDNTEVKSYRFEAGSVADAVAVVNGLGDAMDLTFNVTEVVTHFE